MDSILAKAGSTAVTFVIRSGITYASSYAIKTAAKLLEQVPEDQRTFLELKTKEVQAKISIVTDAMDLIRLAAARGNTILESTVQLADSLIKEIELYNSKLTIISENFETSDAANSIDNAKNLMSGIIKRLEEHIPLFQLSISTSGIKFNGTLPHQISPGRLIQASSMINEVKNFKYKTQIGPTFDIIMYSIFYNPSRQKNVENTSTNLSPITWKEDLARASVKLYKTNKFEYSIEIIEDFNDNRYHEDSEKPRRFVYKVSNISRLFFSASGKLLKLEGNNSPVLILKVIKDDVESFIAFGETGTFFDEEEGDDDDDEQQEEEQQQQLQGDSNDDDPDDSKDKYFDAKQIKKETSLSLLEYLLRLSSLESNDHVPISQAKDERLSLYLSDENHILNKNYKNHKDEKLDSSINHTSNTIRLESLNLEK